MGSDLHPVKLALIELSVKSALLEQLVVAALFHNLSVPHDQNDVGGADGGEPVGHNEAGAALHHALEDVYKRQAVIQAIRTVLAKKQIGE